MNKHIKLPPLLPGERWKEVEGYELGYIVSNMGRMARLRTNGQAVIRICVSHIGGYSQICLGKYDNRLVHILVARAFKRNPQNKKLVNHKNCDKSDNRAANLEWVTPKENINHAIQNNRMDYLFTKNKHLIPNAKNI